MAAQKSSFRDAWDAISKPLLVAFCIVVALILFGLIGLFRCPSAQQPWPADKREALSDGDISRQVQEVVALQKEEREIALEISLLPPPDRQMEPESFEIFSRGQRMRAIRDRIFLSRLVFHRKSSVAPWS